MKNKKFVSLFMCISLMLVSTILYAPEISAQSQDLESLQSQQSEIEAKIKASDEKLKQLESDRASEQKIVDTLNIQLSTISDQFDNIKMQKAQVAAEIETTETNIADMSVQIDDIGKDIEQKNAEIDETVNLLCDRLRANYISGGVPVLELFNSKNLSSFLNRIELFMRVTRSDRELLDTLNAEISSIESLKEELVEEVTELEVEKANLETKKVELQQKETELTQTEMTIREKSSAIDQKIQKLNLAHSEEQGTNAELSQRYDSIKDIILQARRKTTTTTTTQQRTSDNRKKTTTEPTTKPHRQESGWIWPVPYSDRYVTSNYGYRSDPATGATKFHSGVDISMDDAYGKNLVAVRSGEVIFTGYMEGGYGNYIIIDHGDGFSSLYGHCSKLIASDGAYVNQGDVIALIGSTGYSTGPHVHFEIRYNGETVNPFNYLP